MVGDYTFILNGRACEPIYSDNLKKVYQLQADNYFYTIALSGELSFTHDDFDFIMSQPFDTKFIVTILYKGVPYYTGYFTRTDGKENFDDKILKVSLTTEDTTSDVLANLDKEYNIVALKPNMEQVSIDKRPLIQIYTSGSESLSCYLNGITWEKKVLKQVFDDTTLRNTYYFSKIQTAIIIYVKGTYSLPITGLYRLVGDIDTTSTFEKITGDYKIRMALSSPGGTPIVTYTVIRKSDNYVAYASVISNITMTDLTEGEFIIPISPASGSTATGTGSGEYKSINIYARLLTDRDQAVDGSSVSFNLPEEDIVELNRNYRRVIGYPLIDGYISYDYSTEPTEYGMNNERNYFLPPQDVPATRFYPTNKDKWITYSIWYAIQDGQYEFHEPNWRRQYWLKDAYSFSSVVNLLLKQINPSYSFKESNSQFLYSDSTLKQDGTRLFLTQKTNILKGLYDSPAQKALLSLKQLFDMLKSVYNCYWHMDGNELHIEHISYYKNGKSYLAPPSVGVNLVTFSHSKHYRPYTFQANNYTYSKSDLPKSIKYAWGEAVTAPFLSQGIECLSELVQKDKTEEYTVTGFNPDVDYMLLNYDEVSNDGFALLAASQRPATDLINRSSSDYKVGYGLRLDGTIYANSGLIVSNFIAVDQQTLYGAKYSGELLCWYTANKTFIAWQYSSDWNTKGVTPPKDAAFVRISYYYTESDNVFMKGTSLHYFWLSYDGWNNTQNSYLSFNYLVSAFHTYDLPSDNVLINGSTLHTVHGIRRTKKQNIWFSAEQDPNPMQLIRTQAGDGQIEKMEINLTSRRVDLSLRYDTY